MTAARNAKTGGMTLLEILVTLIVTAIVCSLAYGFYRNFMGSLDRQRQVTALQEGIRNAVDCINRYLVAGGVAGDSLFFDPHRKLSSPIVNGGHRVFEMDADSTTLLVYGNWSGTAASLAAPVVDKASRWIKVDKAFLFKPGAYAYIYAGSAQEVARVSLVRDSVLYLENDFFTYYPKGTLIFPLERIRIFAGPNRTLMVSRERADGGSAFVRDFTPTARPGDSLEFKVRSLDRQAGQLAYSLTFAAKTRKNVLLARRSEQTVFVRGF